jgi:hypothetical protein
MDKTKFTLETFSFPVFFFATNNKDIKANRDDQVCERDKDIGKVFSVF